MSDNLTKALQQLACALEAFEGREEAAQLIRQTMAERAEMQQQLAEAQAELESRRKALGQVSEDRRREWERAEKAEAALAEALRDNQLAEGAAREMAVRGGEEHEARMRAEAACVALREALEYYANSDWHTRINIDDSILEWCFDVPVTIDDPGAIARDVLNAPNPGADLLDQLRSNCSGAQASNAALRRVLDYVRMALEAQHARCEDGACSFCGTVYGVAAEAHDKGCPRYVIGEALSSLNNGADLLEAGREVYQALVAPMHNSDGHQPTTESPVSVS